MKINKKDVNFAIKYQKNMKSHMMSVMNVQKILITVLISWVK